MLTQAEKDFLDPDLKKLVEPAGTDPFEMLRIHRDERDRADELGIKLAELVSNKKGSKRTGETAEDIFFKRQKLFCHIARRFHPLCTYGRSVLEELVDQRRIYEKKVGRVICAIDRNSSKNFAAVMSADMLDDVEAGKYRAVGIIARTGGEACGAGSLAYYYDKSEPDGKRLLRIVWLYIHPDYRQRGLADILIAEVLHAAVRNKTEVITADIETGEALESIGTVLDKWFFRFTPGVDSNFICRISDIANIRVLKEYIGKAQRLSAVSEADSKRLVKRFFRGSRHAAYITYDSLPVTYIDEEMSFYTGSLLKPGAMLIAHRKPSGEISAEYVCASPAAEDDFEILIGNFAAAAAVKYGRKAQICINIENETDGDMLDDLFPKQMGAYMAEAILNLPQWDADEKDVEEALKLTDKKKSAAKKH